MASRKLLAPRTAVYHDGRGSEPMIDVGSVFPADALNIFLVLLDHSAHCADYEHARQHRFPNGGAGELLAVTEIRANFDRLESLVGWAKARSCAPCPPQKGQGWARGACHPGRPNGSGLWQARWQAPAGPVGFAHLRLASSPGLSRPPRVLGHRAKIIRVAGTSPATTRLHPCAKPLRLRQALSHPGLRPARAPRATVLEAQRSQWRHVPTQA